MAEKGSVSTIRPSAALVEDHARLRVIVDAALDKLARGVLPTKTEREKVDFKAEAGRRAKGGLLLPGQPHDVAAADQLADEVAVGRLVDWLWGRRVWCRCWGVWRDGV